MTDAWQPYQVALRIPSRMEWLDLVDRVASGIAAHLDLDEAETDAIANSVVEAGTNAIQHGHRYDERLPVDLVFEVLPDRLNIRVHDRGPGFDASKVPRLDPTSPDGILALCGRGIFIMRSLMDEVEFVIVPGEGCTAILTKHHRRTG
jgi:serine/threonine-protein kinase RsbW